MKTKQKATSRKTKCINHDCPTRGVEYARGLCEPCYRTICRLVRLGRISGGWAGAESRALCRAKQPAGIKRFPIEASRKNGTSGTKAVAAKQ